MAELIFRWHGETLGVQWPRDAVVPRKGDRVILPGGKYVVTEVVHHLGDHFKEAGVEGETFPFVKTYIDVHATDGSTPHRPV